MGGDSERPAYTHRYTYIGCQHVWHVWNVTGYSLHWCFNDDNNWLLVTLHCQCASSNKKSASNSRLPLLHFNLKQISRNEWTISRPPFFMGTRPLWDELLWSDWKWLDFSQLLGPSNSLSILPRYSGKWPSWRWQTHCWEKGNRYSVCGGNVLSTPSDTINNGFPRIHSPEWWTTGISACREWNRDKEMTIGIPWLCQRVQYLKLHVDTTNSYIIFNRTYLFQNINVWASICYINFWDVPDIIHLLMNKILIWRHEFPDISNVKSRHTIHGYTWVYMGSSGFIFQRDFNYAI